MKFWFSKKGYRETREAKAPFDATVEQTLRAAQDVSATPEEKPARDIFDIFSTLRQPRAPGADAALNPDMPRPDARPPSMASSETGRPAVPRIMRDEMERRAANYRALQMKLNDDREARIRKTMADVRIKLQRIGSQDPHSVN